jgi:hypothetical protein
LLRACVIDDRLKWEIKEYWCNVLEDSLQILEGGKKLEYFLYTEAAQKVLGLSMRAQFSRNSDHNGVLRVPFF